MEDPKFQIALARIVGARGVEVEPFNALVEIEAIIARDGLGFEPEGERGISDAILAGRVIHFGDPAPAGITRASEPPVLHMVNIRGQRGHVPHDGLGLERGAKVLGKALGIGRHEPTFVGQPERVERGTLRFLGRKRLPARIGMVAEGGNPGRHLAAGGPGQSIRKPILQPDPGKPRGLGLGRLRRRAHDVEVNGILVVLPRRRIVVIPLVDEAGAEGHFVPDLEIETQVGLPGGAEGFSGKTGNGAGVSFPAVERGPAFGSSGVTKGGVFERGHAEFRAGGDPLLERFGKRYLAAFDAGDDRGGGDVILGIAQTTMARNQPVGMVEQQFARARLRRGHSGAFEEDQRTGRAMMAVEKNEGADAQRLAGAQPAGHVRRVMQPRLIRVIQATPADLDAGMADAIGRAHSQNLFRVLPAMRVKDDPQPIQESCGRHGFQVTAPRLQPMRIAAKGNARQLFRGDGPGGNGILGAHVHEGRPQTEPGQQPRFER